MNYIDFLIIAALLYAGWKGFKHGLIIEVFTLLALLVGLYAGIHFSDFIAGLLKNSLSWHSKYVPVVSFTITFLGVGAIVFFAGKAIEKVVKVTGLTPINKGLGLFFSILKMTYYISVIIILIESYDEKNDFFPEKTKKESLLYNPIKKVSTSTIPGISESTIFLKNAFKPETDSTGLKVDQVLRVKEIADSLGIDANNAKEIIKIHEKYDK
jgi:membrane protein required for colicin V production